MKRDGSKTNISPHCNAGNQLRRRCARQNRISTDRFTGVHRRRDIDHECAATWLSVHHKYGAIASPGQEYGSECRPEGHLTANSGRRWQCRGNRHGGSRRRWIQHQEADGTCGVVVPSKARQRFCWGNTVRYVGDKCPVHDAGCNKVPCDETQPAVVRDASEIADVCTWCSRVQPGYVDGAAVIASWEVSNMPPDAGKGHSYLDCRDRHQAATERPVAAGRHRHERPIVRQKSWRKR